MKECILQAGLFAMVMSATEGVFTAPSLENFLTLASGWLLCRTRRTTTGLIVAARAVGQKHFSRFHAFFAQGVWNSRELWLGVMRAVVRGLVPTGEIVLVGDDTVQGKSGKKIAGAANWRNGCGSTRQQYRFLWGLNLVIMGAAVDFCGKTFCLPINLRLYRKPEDCRKERRLYRTRSELMREMVQEALETFDGRRMVLLVDCHYATTGTLRCIARRRSDRLAAKVAPGSKGRAFRRPSRPPGVPAGPGDPHRRDGRSKRL